MDFFVVLLLIFFAKVAGSVIETEKNFGEIIEIINDTMVIEGAEKDGKVNMLFSGDF